MVPAPATVVPEDWSLIPSGLSKGDKFRLLFLSSTKRSIRSTNISDYNTFVQNRVAAGHTDSDISGATNATYTLENADLGKTIKVKVTFTDEGGTEETPEAESSSPVYGSVRGGRRSRGRAGAGAEEKGSRRKWSRAPGTETGMG